MVERWVGDQEVARGPEVRPTMNGGELVHVAQVGKRRGDVAGGEALSVPRLRFDNGGL